MAKVSNQDIYNQDDNLSMEDYLLGTNTNTINKKTQTYSLGSIFSLFYNFLGFNAFLFTTDTTTYPIGTPGCFFVFDEEDNLTNDFTESRKITFSATDTYNFNVAEYFGIVVNSGKFLFKLINLEDKNNFIFLKPSNFVLGGTGTTFNVDVLAESGLSNGSFVNYKRYLLVLEFAAGTFDPADYDLTDFTNTSGNPFVRQDALDLKLNISDYNDRFKGKYTSLVNLEAAHPTSNTGDYAIVDSGSGSDAIEYIFDEEEGWVQGNSVGSSTTDGLVEGSSNLYFTTARVLATVLSGLSLATGGAIVSTDSILVAFGKIQNQINNLVTLNTTQTITGAKTLNEVPLIKKTSTYSYPTTSGGTFRMGGTGGYDVFDFYSIDGNDSDGLGTTQIYSNPEEGNQINHISLDNQQVSVLRINYGQMFLRHIFAGQRTTLYVDGKTAKIIIEGTQNKYATLGTSLITGNKNFEFPDKNGTLALSSDIIESAENKVDKDTTAGVLRFWVYGTDGIGSEKPLSDFKDVLEFANLTAFPVTGATGKIYVALDTNKTYRWTGSTYVQIGGGEIYIKNISVSGGYTVDFNVDTHRLTLTGNTTFSEINLPALGFSKTITLHINGNFGVVFPASWTQYISGAYNGTATLNTIVIETIGTERKVQISQPD